MVKNIFNFQYLALMAICVLFALSSCGDDKDVIGPDGVRSHVFYPQNEFVVVSGDQNTVTFSLNPDEDFDVPAPAKWDGITVRYTYVDSQDTDYHKVFCNNDVSKSWGGSTSSYTDSNGNPVVSVTLPPNNTGKIIAYQIGTSHWYDSRNVAGLFGYIYQLPDSGSTETDVMRIRWKGEIFESQYSLDEKDNYTFENESFRSLISGLSGNPDVRMVILEDGIVDYIDMKDPDVDGYMRSLLPEKSEDESLTRSYDIPGFQYMGTEDYAYFAFFNNDNFKGDYIHYSLTHLYNSYNIPSLKPYKLNDKITSIAVAYNYSDPALCSVVTIWEDTDFNFGDTSRKKHRLSIVATASNRKVSVPDLKNVKCLNGSGSWNDKISSLSGHIGYFGRTVLDY